MHFRPQGGKSAADTCAQFAQLLDDAAEQKADLVVLPETLTIVGNGLTYTTAAESIPGPSTEQLAAVCRRFDVAVVVGLLEQDGERLFNACALVGPRGVISSYRKVHLPFLGVDRFTTPGDRAFGVSKWETCVPSAQREAFRWMLEEFRVSLFAQELGTAQPTSAARLKTLGGYH